MREMTNRIVVAVCSILAMHCGYFANLTARHLSQARLEEGVREARVTIPDSEKFLACYRAAGGSCPPEKASARINTSGLAAVSSGRMTHRLAAAHRVLNHEVHDQVITLFNSLQKTDTAQSVTLELSRLSDFSSAVDEATQVEAWDELAFHANLQLAAARNARAANASNANQQAETDAEMDARVAAFITAYMKAYFRNGRFATVTVGGTEKFGVVDDAGFVTRDGNTFQFPAITAKVTVAAQPTVEITQLDASAIGADLVRVYFEAIFDAHNRLPAVSNATGVAIANYALLEHGKTNYVKDDEFALVQQRANQADAAASAAFGRLVRGTSWVSLNNEAVAKLLESIVGVTVRKATEKAVWCWYACSPGAMPQTKMWQETEVRPHAVTVRIR